MRRQRGGGGKGEGKELWKERAVSIFLLPSQLTAKCDARESPEWISWI